MTTYRRFTCVQRSIGMFLNQDYEGETELVIMNTDDEHPIKMGPELGRNRRVKVINNNIDHVTGNKYDNIGSIRRDALKYATGTHYICWDDDDIFLPWNIRQCVDGLNRNSDMWAWKPEYSLFWDANKKIHIAGNVMEASIIASIDRIKEFGFAPHKGGGEHLSWLEKFQKLKKIIVDKNSIPAYCFNWSDEGIVRGHKQSGTIDNPDNFNHHKANTKDYANKPLESVTLPELTAIYSNFTPLLENNIDKPINNYRITRENYNKYVLKI